MSVADVVKVPERIISAWAAQDPDAFAEVFTEKGTLVLPNDVLLKGREEVRQFMKNAFAGPYAGTRVTGAPVDVKVLGEDAAVLVTQGGVLAPGETEVARERAITATWVVTREDGEWRLAAYQNTPRF
ncbi:MULTISPECIES: SgcJ/EcaC family oxidoreductase [Saccharothrix]|uniref:SgcJ/EcaC family oxidoreductase n=1 Tax=Saccharothrix TaxID=2071 RepID=UPI001F518F63|nr:SgcJ/EcaC family oxidoreductase [Saccharothrix sp. CB00851]